MSQIVGTDGIAPTYNPDGLWTIWDINVIFTGQQGLNKYVPKQNDYVIDPTSGTLYIVSNLNLSDYISTLQQIDIAPLPAILQNQNQVLNPNIPDSVTSYRIYFNSNTSPYTLNVDASLIVYNTLANTAKFFLGTDILNTPQSIAVTLDNNGNVVNDSVPLLSMSYDNSSNTYIKAIPTTYTNQLLQNGDLVTVLIYNAAGQVVSKEILVVEETSGYVGQSQPVKLITGLSLQSPFLSETNPNTISLPSNIPISNVEFTGVVNYNNGTFVNHSVNKGGPFVVFGLDQVLESNILGSVPIILQYTLQPQEYADIGQNYNSKTVSQEYTLELTSPNFDYQYQVYPIPYYNGTQFIMKWFLLSMSRNIFIDVSPYMSYTNGTGFNGALYNQLQSMVVSLNMSTVAPTLQGLTLEQNCQLNLSNVSQGPSTIYEIYTNSNLSSVPYGTNVRAKSLNNSNTILDITCQNYQLSNWLNQIYYANLPVTNSQLESSPPVPTHFDIIYNVQALTNDQLYTNSSSQRFQIQQWNQNITLSNINKIPLNSTILIRFLLVNGNTTSILSVSPMMITNY